MRTARSVRQRRESLLAVSPTFSALPSLYIEFLRRDVMALLSETQKLCATSLSSRAKARPHAALDHVSPSFACTFFIYGTYLRVERALDPFQISRQSLLRHQRLSFQFPQLNLCQKGSPGLSTPPSWPSSCLAVRTTISTGQSESFLAATVMHWFGALIGKSSGAAIERMTR